MNDLISLRIKEKAKECGFEQCGITQFSQVQEYDTLIKKRMNSCPDSKDLYEKLVEKFNLKENKNKLKSIIVCTIGYGKYKVPNNIDKYYGKSYLFDYSKSFTDQYKKIMEFESFLNEHKAKVIFNEVPARLAFCSAGLGDTGKNNFSYNEKSGSWFRIYTWAVDVELEYDENEDIFINRCPKNCNKCVKACPTKALKGPFDMDMRKCIAYQSYRVDKLHSEELRENLGEWIYGCDACQNACPRNNGKWIEDENFYDIDNLKDNLTPEKILNMDEKKHLEIIFPRFDTIPEERIWLWKCNAIRSMANSKNKEYLEILKALKSEDKNIIEMRDWAVKKLDVI